MQSLLEKLPFQTISLNPNSIGKVDLASKEVIQVEIKQSIADYETKKKLGKKRRRKQRGKNKGSKVDKK